MNKKSMIGGGLLCLAMVGVRLGVGFFVKINNPVISIIVTQLSILLLPVLYVIFIEKKNFFTFIRFKKFHIGSAFLIPVFWFCMLPVVGVVNAISLLFSSDVISSEIGDITGGSVMKGLLLVALLPCFVEEACYRGVLYQSFRGARPVRAIILTALLFGSMHLNFNQFMYATVMGIIMGAVLEATGSIVATMLYHFVTNGFSVIMMTVLPKLTKILEQASGGQQQVAAAAGEMTKTQILSTILMLLPVAIVFGAAGFGVLILMAKLNKRWGYIKFLFAKSTKEQRKALPKPKLLNPAVVIAFVVCIGICTLNELLVRGIIRI